MKRPLDDSTGKKRKSSPASEDSKSQAWTAEEDQFLTEELKEMESANWRVICKRMNKAFKPCRRTSKECEQHWKSLRAELTPSEELLILLSLYHNTLESIPRILDSKI